MFVCLNLGIWGSAFGILLNQVVGGDTEGKNSEGGEMELGKNQNDPNLCSNITRLCFCHGSLFANLQSRSGCA